MNVSKLGGLRWSSALVMISLSFALLTARPRPVDAQFDNKPTFLGYALGDVFDRSRHGSAVSLTAYGRRLPNGRIFTTNYVGHVTSSDGEVTARYEFGLTNDWDGKNYIYSIEKEQIFRTSRKRPTQIPSPQELLDSAVRHYGEPSLPIKSYDVDNRSDKRGKRVYWGTRKDGKIDQKENHLVLEIFNLVGIDSTKLTLRIKAYAPNLKEKNQTIATEEFNKESLRVKSKMMKSLFK